MTIRLGLIGAGNFAERSHWPAIQALSEDLKMVVVCSRTPERVHAVATLMNAEAETDYRRLLDRDDVDAVDICVPIGSAFQIVADALNAGKHVITEKPLAATALEARALCRLADETGKVLVVAENYRYQPKYRHAREIIVNEGIGPVRLSISQHTFSFRTNLAPDNKTWRQQGSFSGGYVMDGGIHVIAALRQMVPEPIVSVRAAAQTINPHLSNGEPDTLAMTATYANGGIASVVMSYSVQDFTQNRHVIYGDTGTVSVISNQPDAGRDTVTWRTGEKETSEIIEFDGGFVGEFQDFVSAIKLGTTPQSTPREGFIDVAIMEAALRAAQTGNDELVMEY